MHCVICRRRLLHGGAIQRALVLFLLPLLISFTFTTTFEYGGSGNIVVVVVVAEGHVDAEEKPHCDEVWTCSDDGNIMAGPVNDTLSCEDACRSCEGDDFLPAFRKSTKETTETSNGKETTVTVVSYRCQCFLQADAASSSCGSGSGSSRRTICIDEKFKASADELDDESCIESTDPSSATKQFAAMIGVEMFLLVVVVVVSGVISFAVVV